MTACACTHREWDASPDTHLWVFIAYVDVVIGAEVLDDIIEGDEELLGGFLVKRHKCQVFLEPVLACAGEQ